MSDRNLTIASRVVHTRAGPVGLPEANARAEEFLAACNGAQDPENAPDGRPGGADVTPSRRDVTLWPISVISPNQSGRSSE